MTAEKTKRRGLGRGLGALFGDEEADHTQGAAHEAPAAGGQGVQRRMAGVDQLEPGTFQPRQHIDEDALKDLADSIAVHGVLQPILVRAKPGNTERFEIIAGERRWRASQKARLHEVPVIVKNLTDTEALEIALIENLQREDLNPLEEARGYKRLMDEFGHTQEALAKGLGKSRSHVANMLRLLTLPPKVLDLVRQSKLSAGHARALIGVDNPEEFARHIIEQGLSVRSTEVLAATNPAKAAKKKKSVLDQHNGKDVDTLALEKEISGQLGLSVTIDMKTDGKGGRAGVLKISYKTLDQLDDVLKRLSQTPARF